MPCPRDGTPLLPFDLGTAHLERCPSCRGVWGAREALEGIAGGPIVSRATSISLGDLDDESSPACPSCDGRLQPEESRAAPGRELLVCNRCGHVWLDQALLSTLQAGRSLAEPKAHRKRSEPPPSERQHSSLGETRDGSDDEPSVFAPGPAIEFSLTLAFFGLAWMLAATRFGETLSYLPRIQFHELGHAMVAWSTGRKALPLPCGLTFWSLERSWLLVAIQALFLALLATHGVRTRSLAAMGFAAAMVGILAVGLTTPLAVSEEWLVAGGTIGEALLPALALLAFHLPLPKRFRWDFWRWPLAVFALIALAAVVQTGWQISSGERPLPFGSIMGQSMDGDLERLVHDHGWPEESLRPFFGGLATLAFTVAWLPHALICGLRWLHGRSTR